MINILVLVVIPTLLILFLGVMPAYFLWTRWFNPNPFGKNPISSRYFFKNKPIAQVQLETANLYLSRGDFARAEKEFRALLKTLPSEVSVHLGLAESLFDQSIKGIKRDPAKRIEALEHYKWAIDFYTKAGESDQVLALYKRLLGPYSEEELGIKIKQ